MNATVATSLKEDKKVKSASTLLFALVLLAGAVFASWKGLNPPAPIQSAGPLTFSANRAMSTLSLFLGDGSPHPTGTASNAAVRERILAQLKNYGYEPHVQSAFTCSSSGACAQVNNIIAELPGQSAPYVLVAAHYDSVGAGPGASDDGAGAAAVLEIARALKSAPKLRHSVIFLIDDGEELGLLGAKAFMEQHPLAREIHWAVNMEARGTSGPSLMFETSPGNKDLIRLYGKAAPHPVANSLLYEIYRSLPNDTDFTIFKAHNIEGFNLAFIGDAAQYHRPGDSIANLSAASLQDQGNHALSLALALANGTDAPKVTENAVFFDVMGLALLSWPARMTLFIVGLAFAFIAFATVSLRKRQKLTASSLLRGAATWLCVTGAAAFSSILLYVLLGRTGALATGWGAHPLPAAVAFVALAVSIATTGARYVVRREIIWPFLLANAAIFALLSLAVFSSGTVYIFLLPAISAGFALALTSRHANADGMAMQLAAVLPVVIVALVWTAMLRLFFDGLGTLSLPIVAVFSAVMIVPLFTCGTPEILRRIVIGSAVVAAIGAVSLYAFPRYSEQAPFPVSIVLHEDAGSGATQWVLTARSFDRSLQPMLQDAGLTFTRTKPYPWAPWPMFTAPGSRLELPAPVLESMQVHHEQDYLGVSGRLRSPRGATQAELLFPPGTKLASASVAGVPVPISPAGLRLGPDQWRRLICVLPPEGVDISFVIDSQHAGETYIEDESFGLPEAGRRLALTRPKAAASVQNGDATVVSRRLSDVISSEH